MDKKEEKELIIHFIEKTNWSQLVLLSRLDDFALRNEAANQAMRLICREGVKSVKEFMFEADASTPIEVYDGPGGEGSIGRGMQWQRRENAIGRERALMKTPAWKELLELSQDSEFPLRDAARNVAVEMANIELERIEACRNWKGLKDIAVLLPVPPEHPIRKKAAHAVIEMLKNVEKWGEILEVVSDERFPLKATEVQRLIADAIKEKNMKHCTGRKNFPRPHNILPIEGGKAVQKRAER